MGRSGDSTGWTVDNGQARCMLRGCTNASTQWGGSTHSINVMASRVWPPYTQRTTGRVFHTFKYLTVCLPQFRCLPKSHQPPTDALVLAADHISIWAYRQIHHRPRGRSWSHFDRTSAINHRQAQHSSNILIGTRPTRLLHSRACSGPNQQTHAATTHFQSLPAHQQLPTCCTAMSCRVAIQ